MGFRIHRGIWQFQKSDGTYESKYRINSEGTLVETDTDGNEAGNFVTTPDWSNITGKPTNLSSFANDLGNYGGWLTTSGKAADANLLDGIDSSAFVRSNANDTISGRLDFTAGESIRLYGIRGQFTNEYIHLYNKVGIGHPNGWGQGEGNTPAYGLSTYGGMNIAYGNGASSTINGYLRINQAWAGGDYGAEQLTIRGTYPSIALRSITHNSKWLIHNDNNLSFYYGSASDDNSWARKFQIPTDGNIWMSWANDYISNLLDSKQAASTAINTGNIGSQSVNYATTAGSANAVAWGNVSGKPSTFSPSSHTHDDRYYTEAEVDTKFAENNPIHSGSDFVDGTLVKTRIGASGTNGASFVMEVTGKSYTSGHSPFSLVLQGYIYNNTFISTSAISNGTSFPSPIKILEFGGELCFWWPRWGYWNSFQVSVRDAGGSRTNLAYYIENSTEPDSAKKVSVTPFQSWSTYNFSQSSVNNWNTAHGWGNHASQGYITAYGAQGANGNFYVDDNYGNSVVGVYSSTRYQGVWAMGDAYKLAANGTSTGSLYGIAWTHQNIGGESISGLGHQMLIMSNGDTRSAIGDGIWTKYNISTTSYGSADQWATAYGWGNHASAGYQAASTAITTSNIGSQSVSNADTVDSLHASSFLRSDSTNSLFRTTAGNGLGLRFWDSDNYKIWMSSTSDGTWGGRLDSTSDYNMYFKMSGGTNRGFAFKNSTTTVAQIDGSGVIYTALNGNSSQWDSAYRWGNHASAGYLTRATQLYSPNSGVVAADAAMPSAGQSFIHTLGLGPSNNDGHILGMTWTGTTVYGAQIFIDTDPNDIMAIRSRSNAGAWTSWKTVIHSGTIGSQSVNYANSAGAVSWSNVSGKPSTFSPSSHTHDDRYYTESEVNTLLGGYASTDTATTGRNGLMSSTDKSKLDGVAANANNYSLPSSISLSSVAIGSGVTLSESTDRADLLYINSSTSGWGGIQIGNTSNEFIFSLMGNGSAGGIYDDQNSDWIIDWTENAGVTLYHNANPKLLTVSDGVNITGRLYASEGIQVPYGAGEHRPMVVLNGATTYGLFHTEATNDEYTFDFNGTQMYKFRQDGVFTINGNTITTGKVSNWDTAYGWGNHASAGYASSSHDHSSITGTAQALSIRGYGTDSFSFQQTSSTFAGWGGWANHFIGNHGNGATYYNTIHTMPFWGPPRYSRLEGGDQTESLQYWTEENFDPGSKASLNGSLGTDFYANKMFSDNWFRAKGACGLYFEDYGYGLWSAYSGGATYGNVSTYATGRNGWTGYSVNNWISLMAIDTRRGLFLTDQDRWLIKWDNSEAFSDYEIRMGSDGRNKSNVQTLTNSLDKVLSLRGVSYNYKNQEKTSIGFIAQEVKEVIPEVVSLDSEGYYAVGYQNLVAVLAEAIKEQQAQIDELKQIINNLTK